MNCTICKKPVEEHEEGRETDFCIGLATGRIKKVSKGWYEIKVPNHLRTRTQPEAEIWIKCRKKDITDHDRWLPSYSDPTMSAETWGLVEKIAEIEYVWSTQLEHLFYQKNLEMKYSVYVFGDETYQGMTVRKCYSFDAPTPTLAICRAFLAVEER